jgi:hypothetical protein
VSSIRRAYQLDNKVPTDYNEKNYGQIAAGVLSTAKEQLTAVKNLWAGLRTAMPVWLISFRKK